MISVSGNLDLLIRQTDIARAEQCLIDAGCQARKSFSNEQSCCGFDGKVKIDLHWSLYRDRFRCINPEAWWDRRRVETLFDTEMNLIAQDELLMILSY